MNNTKHFPTQNKTISETSNNTEDTYVISSYSRKQAIEDGVLVDVSEMAKEAGIKWPVAVTAAVWHECIEWPETVQKTYQDTKGRLWDVLSMLRMAIILRRKSSQATKSSQTTVYYKVLVVPRYGKGTKPRLTLLKAVLSSGDNCEPVITIMLPNED